MRSILIAACLLATSAVQAALHRQEGDQKVVLSPEIQTKVRDGCIVGTNSATSDMAAKACQCLVESIQAYVPVSEWTDYLAATTAMQREKTAVSSPQATIRIQTQFPIMAEIATMCAEEARLLK